MSGADRMEGVVKHTIKFEHKDKRPRKKVVVAFFVVLFICAIPMTALAASEVIEVTGSGDDNTRGQVGPVWVTDDTLDAKDDCDTEVVVEGSAELTVTLHYHQPSGTGTTPTVRDVKFLDVLGDDVSGTTSLTVTFFVTNAELPSNIDRSTLGVYWWNGSAWQECSNYSIVFSSSEGYVAYAEVYIDDATSPNLSQMTGTEFMIGGAAADATLDGMVNLLPFIFMAGVVMALVAGVATGMNIEKVLYIGIFAVIGMSLLSVIVSVI